MENGGKVDRPGLEMAELKKFGSVLYFKKEVDGNTLRVVGNSSPTLYPKLMYNAKSERFFTPFYEHKDINDPTDPGTETDPLDFVGKMSYVKAAVKIESIFVSSSITLQVKLAEVDIQERPVRYKRLMSKLTAKKRQ